MSTIITLENFVHGIAIDNAVPTSIVGKALSNSIDHYESKFLQDFLGYGLAKQLKEANDQDVTSGVMFNILNGEEFTDSYGNINKWNGLKSIGSSPIANYVYYMFCKDKMSQTTGLGETAANQNLSISVSSVSKMVRAWNEMVDMNSLFDDYLKVKQVAGYTPATPSSPQQVKALFEVKTELF